MQSRFACRPRGWLEWDNNATIPTAYTRPDAVAFNYTTGYATSADIPEVAKQAVKLWVRIHVEDDPSQMAAIRIQAVKDVIDGLLDIISPGLYR